MTTNRDKIRAAAEAILAMTDSHDRRTHAGRWGWFGNIRQGGPYLATRRNGRWVVMSFAKLGWGSAQPMFPRVAVGDAPILGAAKDLAVYEVAPAATSGDDPAVYRHDVTGFRSPVADYMAAADAEAVLELVHAADDRDALRERIEQAIAEDEAAYVRVINALLVSNAGPDYWRWQGHAEQHVRSLRDLHAVLGTDAPDYRSAEWRATHGVYSDEYLATLRAGA